MVDDAGGAFRRSANEDPHGTRAIAMALHARARKELERPVGPSDYGLVGALAAVGILMIVPSLPDLPHDLFPIVVGSLVLLFALELFWRLRTVRMTATEGELLLRDVRGRQTSHPWKDVNGFELRRSSAQLAIAGRPQPVKVLRLQGSEWQRRASKDPNAPVELNGEFPTVERLFVVGTLLALGIIALPFGFLDFVVEHSFAVLLVGPPFFMLVYFVGRWPSLTAGPEGLDDTRRDRLIPWSQIREVGTTPRTKRKPAVIRLYMNNGKELRVQAKHVPSAVAEITRRVELARRPQARPSEP